MNKRIRTGLLSIGLVGGSFLGAGIVSAQVDDTVSTDTQVEQPVEQPTEQPADAPVDGDPTEGDRAERRAERAERRAERAQATADLLGLDVDTLRAAIEEGQTLAQIAEANGVDVQTVIDAKVEAKTERINTAVADGRLTDVEAAEKLAELEERVTTRVNEGRPERGARGTRGDRPAPAADTVETGS